MGYEDCEKKMLQPDMANSTFFKCVKKLCFGYVKYVSRWKTIMAAIPTSVHSISTISIWIHLLLRIVKIAIMVT